MMIETPIKDTPVLTIHVEYVMHFHAISTHRYSPMSKSAPNKENNAGASINGIDPLLLTL